MYTVELADLYRMDYSIIKVLTMYQRWCNGDSWSTPVNGRVDNGLNFFFGCEATYHLNDNCVKQVKEGDISYVANEGYYTCCFRKCNSSFAYDMNGTNMLINFTLLDENGQRFRLCDSVQIFRPQNKMYYYNSFKQILSLTLKGDAPSARVKALLYNLLTDISLETRKESIISRSYSSIFDAIVYVEHNYVNNISIPVLADMCHVSESCFYRLFREYVGMSPHAYIQHLRIAKAKLLLDSGALTISETAEAVGIYDSAYFSRLFKIKTGLSPTDYLKKSGLNKH